MERSELSLRLLPPVVVPTVTVPPVRLSFPICVAVSIFTPLPLIVIVEFPGAEKVPATERFPPTLMLFATSFVIVPVEVKFPETVQPGVDAIVNASVPLLLTVASVAVPAPDHAKYQLR